MRQSTIELIQTNLITGSNLIFLLNLENLNLVDSNQTLVTQGILLEASTNLSQTWGFSQDLSACNLIWMISTREQMMMPGMNSFLKGVLKKTEEAQWRTKGGKIYWCNHSKLDLLKMSFSQKGLHNMDLRNKISRCLQWTKIVLLRKMEEFLIFPEQKLMTTTEVQK